MRLRLRPRTAGFLTGLIMAAGCGGAMPQPDSPPGPPAPPIRALVYNIHAGHDAEGEGNLERVAALVGETGADVALLQEVDRGTRRSGGVDQLGELERLTGFHGAFGRTLDYDGGEYGIAILSRWPILSDTLIHLPVEPAQERAGGSYEPRGALRVTVDAPGGVVGVVNTHLDASGSDVYRRQEVEAVRRIAGDLRATHPRTLVGGDFNAEPGSIPIDRMTEAGWQDAWARCGTGLAHGAAEVPGGTYPADSPIKRIDYLFLAPGLACEGARVLETTTSDHRPLLVTVTGDS